MPELAHELAMTLHENSYAAFMLDHAAGALSPGEQLVGDAHCALSTEGRSIARMMDAIAGALLESSEASSRPPMPALNQRDRFDPVAVEAPGVGSGPPSASEAMRLTPEELLALPWRRTLFGLQTLKTDTPMTSLLRLDPGGRAPGHGHGRRDVTVVLCGSFADEYGVYERGDLAFAEPGMKHAPRAVGDTPCVCMIATEPGRPLRGLIGLFGWVGARNREAA